MNTQLNVYKQLLTSVSYNGDQHTHFMVKENNSAATLKSLRFNISNGDWFVFEPEKCQGRARIYSPLLRTGGQFTHHKACDAVFLMLKEDILNVIYIELKSTTPKGGVIQLKSTRCFLSYLHSIADELYSTKMSLDERFVVFYSPENGKRTLNKKPTIAKKHHTLSNNSNNPTREIVSNNDHINLIDFL